MTQLQCLKSSHLKREAADDGFSENAPSRHIYVKVASFFPYFSLWLQFHFLNTFLLSSRKYFPYAWEVQGTPMERNSSLLFFQTIRGPLGMGPSPERSHLVTNTGLGAAVSLITGETRHLSCFTLQGFSLKEHLLLIHHCQKYYSWCLRKEGRISKDLT